MSDYFTGLIEKEDERRRINQAYKDLRLESGKRHDEIERLKAQVRYWECKARKMHG